MRFSLCFEKNLNTNNDYFHIEIMISAAHMLRGSGHVPLRKFRKHGIIWCVLMYILIRFYYKNYQYFIFEKML